jgi:hypothetical protein
VGLGGDMRAFACKKGGVEGFISVGSRTDGGLAEFQIISPCDVPHAAVSPTQVALVRNKHA